MDIFSKCLNQDEAFMYTFDFSKMVPELVYKILKGKHIDKKSLCIPNLLNESPVLAQLAAYVKE